MADLIIAVAVGLTATYYALWVLKDTNTATSIFLAGIAAVLPDALEGPYIFMQKETGVLNVLTNIQRKMQFQAPLPWGMITQLIVILVSLLVISSSIIR